MPLICVKLQYSRLSRILGTGGGARPKILTKTQVEQALAPLASQPSLLGVRC